MCIRDSLPGSLRCGMSGLYGEKIRDPANPQGRMESGWAYDDGAVWPFMPPDFAILLVVPIHRILLVAFPSAGQQSPHGQWGLYQAPVWHRNASPHLSLIHI